MNTMHVAAWTMIIPVVIYAVAIVLAAISGRRESLRHWPSWVTAVAGIAGTMLAANALLRGSAQTLDGWTIAAFARMNFRLDPLSAFFLLVISLSAVAAAIYGVGYLDASHQDYAVVPRVGIDGAVAAFLATMSVLVLADGVFGFLIAWELMSIVSFFLVMGDGAGSQRRSAAFTYLVMTHVATAFVIISFLTLSQHAGSFEFAVIRANADSLGSWERNAIFLSALLGFGTKAGLIPLHVWLPKAHPAAPSHVSALMSGVMVKTAMFGLLRIVFEFAGPGPRWWGVALIIAGAISALLGILYALMERDLKRVFAYSTVEHVGIIVIGLGTTTLLFNTNHPNAAALALLAMLVHLFNHALFKSLLFLGAGAVQTGAGTRDLERLGGLVRRMPRTAAFFLVGAVSISALPPLNGFAGEWLLFQSLLRLGSETGTTAMSVLAATGAAVLALTGALAVACFVRAFGIGFLAIPRSDGARNAHEVPGTMQIGMGSLAACCVLAGLFPPILFRLLEPVTHSLTGEIVHPRLGFSGATGASQAASHYAPVLIIALLLVVGVIPWLVARALGGPGRTRVSAPWVCGVELEQRMPCTATAFAKPLRIIFQFLIRPESSVRLDTDESQLFVRSVRYEERLRPIYDRYLYRVLLEVTYRIARQIRPLQSGSVRAYLGYLFVTLIVVILLAR